MDPSDRPSDSWQDDPPSRGPAGRAPTLVLCAHGTREESGRRDVLAIQDAVAGRLPGVEVRTGYVDVQHPSLDEVVAEVLGRGEPQAAGDDAHRCVVVPLLLGPGYHVEVDVARAVTSHPGLVVSTGPLGPDARLALALRDRLVEAGADPEDAVVLAVAGSRRAGAKEGGERMAQELRDVWQGPVTAGFLAAVQPSVADAVTALRARLESGGEAGVDAPESTAGEAGGNTAGNAAGRGDGPQRVVVASHLVGGGFFHRQAGRAGGDLTSAPLAAHPALVDLVVRRYRSAV